MVHNIANSDKLSNLKRCSCKKLQSFTPICRFLQSIWLHTQREDGANASSLRSTQRNHAAIMMLYKSTKVKVCKLDGDTDFFDIVVGVLLGDTLAPYLFIICQNFILWMSIDLMKENNIILEKARSKQYLTWTITDADYADDITLLANTPDQVKSRLHSMKWVAGGIGLHENPNKTEFICFNQSGNISILNSGSIKLMDKFTYPRTSVSSTENDISTQLLKAWTTIEKLSAIWKSDQSNEKKCNFFQTVVVSMLLYGCTT